jgi:MFS transporter, OFA family, oxalate/formate antiporter
MKSIFYGWFVLFGLVSIYAVSNGIGIYALPLLLPEMGREFELGSEAASRLPALLFLTTAVMATIVGGLLDKFGARWLIITGGIGLTITFGCLPYVSSYKQLIAFYVFYAIFISLSGIVSSIYLLNRWFNRYKGLAIGIFLAASSVGGVIFIQIAKAHIEEGWRVAASWMSIFGAIFTLIPILLLREKPADKNTVIDGQLEPVALQNIEKSILGNVSLQQALNMPIFYLVVITTCILWFCINGFMQNQGYYYKDLKIDAATGANVATLFSVCAILGKLLFGFLSDKFDKGTMMLAAIVCLTMGCVLLKMSASNTAYLTPFALIFGLGFSGSFAMIQLWVARLFYGDSYGRILGVITMADTLAGSYGIVQIGAMHEEQGNFIGAFSLMIVLCCVAVVCTYLVKRIAK